MNDLNVLLVTYSFPPVGGTGVMRAASLARYLPAEGIRLDVLTARNASAVGSDAASAQGDSGGSHRSPDPHARSSLQPQEENQAPDRGPKAAGRQFRLHCR